MKTKHIKAVVTAIMTFAVTCLFAQAVKESSTPLSSKARKGYLEDVSFADGNVEVIYKIPGDKKKDEKFFEAYSFDKDLKFIATKSTSEPKILSKPDREQKYMSAWVGGHTSFDILSMKLRVRVRTVKEKWDYKKQRYVVDKVVSDETVKLKNEGGRNYYGVEQFRSEETGDFIVLAYIETKDKKNPKQFMLLTITFDGEVTEKNLDVTGAYSMVFCKEMSEEAPGKAVGKQDLIIVLAPKKGAADVGKYVYLHYDMKGTLKNKIEFQSPSSNLLVNSADVKNGEVFLSGLSRKTKDSYDEVFADYAPIENPNYTGNENAQMDRYARAASDEMDNFHFLKFSGNKMVFATTAPIDGIKSKKKIAPGEKSGKLYTGKKFGITNFEVTPANEYLITGQITGRVNIGDLKNPNFVTSYGDVVCLQFDESGNVKAQYAVDKLFEDKKSEIFYMPQRFFVSGDGKYAYWEIMEVKGFSGYDSYWDAVDGRKTFRPKYFPRITRIDLQTATLSEFKIPGQKKFFTYTDGRYFDAASLTATYVGRDDDAENLWVSTVTFN
jgi:hypothetical protein